MQDHRSQHFSVYFFLCAWVCRHTPWRTCVASFLSFFLNMGLGVWNAGCQVYMLSRLAGLTSTCEIHLETHYTSHGASWEVLSSYWQWLEDESHKAPDVSPSSLICICVLKAEFHEDLIWEFCLYNHFKWMEYSSKCHVKHYALVDFASSTL